MRGKVSLERIQAFLYETELLDNFDAELNGTISQGSSAVSDQTQGDTIGLSNIAFSWSKEEANTPGPAVPSTPRRRQFRLTADGTVLFVKGGINLVIGPTFGFLFASFCANCLSMFRGSGKTSVLMALLGEMHCVRQPVPTSSNVPSWVNLPRDGGVAYAAQESWVQSETIKANILFGSPYEEEKYRKGVSVSSFWFGKFNLVLVLYQCALERDLELFDAGDATEVGEKGLTLRYYPLFFTDTPALLTMCGTLAVVKRLASHLLAHYTLLRRSSFWTIS